MKTFSNMCQRHVSPHCWAPLLFPFISLPLASLFAWSGNGSWLPAGITGRKRCEHCKAVLGQQVPAVMKVRRWNNPFWRMKDRDLKVIRRILHGVFWVK